MTDEDGILLFGRSKSKFLNLEQEAAEECKKKRKTLRHFGTLQQSLRGRPSKISKSIWKQLAVTDKFIKGEALQVMQRKAADITIDLQKSKKRRHFRTRRGRTANRLTSKMCL